MTLTAALQHHREPTVPTRRLAVLRGFELRGAGGGARDVPAGGQRVLALLAMHDRTLSRTFVAGTLWGDLTEMRANANLRSALWRLRQTEDCIVESTAEHVRLGADIAVDFRAAAAQARRIVETGETHADDDHWSLAYDLLPDWYDEWVGVERERFRHLRLHALERLAVDHAAARRYALAVDAGLLAVAGEPLRESAQRVLISVHIAEGNLDEAARQYRCYCALLADELGIRPSAELTRLVDETCGR